MYKEKNMSLFRKTAPPPSRWEKVRVGTIDTVKTHGPGAAIGAATTLGLVLAVKFKNRIKGTPYNLPENRLELFPEGKIRDLVEYCARPDVQDWPDEVWLRLSDGHANFNKMKGICRDLFGDRTVDSYLEAQKTAEVPK